ncbi:MAG: hypothetical protein ACHQZQ_08440 [SAR324 cluster bacterium]
MAAKSQSKPVHTASAAASAAGGTAERSPQGADSPAGRPPPGADPAAGRLPPSADRTIQIATVSLRDAYPFPEPHFSADVVTSQVDKSRPVGSQKSAQLTYHESAGLLAVRGVRRDKSEWTCLIPASNIKGMRVL